MEYTRFLIEENARNPRGLRGEANVGSGAREISCERIQEILEDHGTGGAVICGPAGSGRSLAFEEGFSGLADPPRLVRLNGSTFGKQVPGSILSFLLAQLDLPGTPARHELVHGLARILCPSGRGAVVLLGRPELVDEESGSLLAQLTAMGKIKLVVICEQIQELPDDILSLFRSGKLQRLVARRMDAERSRKYLHEALGADVSALAAATLQRLANSNRGLMLKLARIWIADGQLVQHDSTWVLRSGELVPGQGLSTLFNSMVSGLSGTERHLLYMLALGGPVPVDTIHREGIGQALDGLLATGHVGFNRHPSNTVAIKVPLLALLLRRDLDDERRAELELGLSALHPDPHGALTHATLRGLVDSGQYRQLIEVAEQFGLDGYSAEAWTRDPQVRTRILALHAGALSYSCTPDAIGRLLAMASEGLREAQLHAAEDDQLARAVQEFELLSQRVSEAGVDMDGAQQAVIPFEASLQRNDWMSESLYLRALVSQIEGWAMQRGQRQALEAVGQVGRELEALRSSGQMRLLLDQDDAAELEARLLSCQLAAGDWKQALTRADLLAEGRYPNPRIIAYAEAVRGILYGLFDETDAALQVLLPSLHQLLQEPPSRLRTAVEAVVTYVLMSRGRAVEGTELLLKEPEAREPQPPLGFLTWVAELFSSLAVARLDSPLMATSRLRAIAENFRQTGLTGLEMFTLAFAMRLGDAQAVPRMEQVAQSCSGSIAGHYGALGRAVATKNSSELIGALHELAREGHLLMAVGADNMLLAGLGPAEQRKLGKLIGSLKQPATPRGMVRSGKTDEQEYTADWMQVLTKRETQIARCAIAGHSNQEIARNNGVSIRTVEGHLYQVYSKLQVRNRQELTSLDRASRRTAGH